MALEVKIAQPDNEPVIILKDTYTGTWAEIFAFGAMLNRYCIQLPGGELNVIDGFENVKDARRNMTTFFKSAKLAPFVCRIKNRKYHFGDASHQLSKFALGKHAIHGLIYDAIFSIVETVTNDDSACVKLQHVYDRQDEGYPFGFRCEVEYTLHKGNELVLKTTITNIDNQLIPVADGWHPYFSLGDRIDDCQMEFQSKEMLEFDEELIPTGKLLPYQEFGSLEDFGTTWFDNCFTVNFAECQPMCVFRNPRKSVQVEIHPAKEYPYLQIYTPDHRKSIAIENLSAAPDALNNAMGLKVLEPHESATFTTKYILRTL